MSLWNEQRRDGQRTDGDEAAWRFVERRRQRLPDPSCPKCQAASNRVKVSARTIFAVFWKCEACANEWSLPKPKPGPGEVLDPRD